jgi:hypothetical protein
MLPMFVDRAIQYLNELDIVQKNVVGVSRFLSVEEESFPPERQ